MNHRAPSAFGMIGLSLWVSACANPIPVSSSFDSSGGMVEVEVLGDGFVTMGDRRIPLEACVLELRQATRQMESSQLLRFVVTLRVAADIQDRSVAQEISLGRDYMIKQLQIMGVRQLNL
jgi:hypothetical protein